MGASGASVAPRNRQPWWRSENCWKVNYWRTLRTLLGVSSQCRNGQKPFHREPVRADPDQWYGMVPTGLDLGLFALVPERSLVRGSLALLSSMVLWRWVKVKRLPCCPTARLQRFIFALVQRATSPFLRAVYVARRASQTLPSPKPFFVTCG